MESRLKQIDDQVKRLEVQNDQYAATHGEFSSEIYNEIQRLMDEREKIFRSLNTVAVPFMVLPIFIYRR